MHVRFSVCRGMPVTTQEDEVVIGTVTDILLDPDRGTVEGFFVCIPGFLSSTTLFLSVQDILRFSMTVLVRSEEVLVEPGEIFRLESLVTDSRTVLRQRMQTKSGKIVGRCRDVQFSTHTWTLEWLFPRSFFRWGVAVSAADILEITPQAIIVKDPVVKVEEKESLISKIPEMVEGVVPQQTRVGKD